MTFSAKHKSTDAGHAPTSAELHESALSYLARSAATAMGVTRALERRIATWSRRALRAGLDAEAVEADVERAKLGIAPIVARLREVGLIDDAAFAERRARSLSLSGKSRRAIAVHLAQKGAATNLVEQILPKNDDDELGAALTLARKKRVGPFARETTDPRARQKALAAMARAGFDFRTCQRALAMDREEAEERISTHRRDKL